MYRVVPFFFVLATACSAVSEPDFAQWSLEAGGDPALAGEESGHSGYDGCSDGSCDTCAANDCACQDPCSEESDSCDPFEVNPPNNQVPCCYSYKETCEVIDGITVCSNEFIPDQYVCRHFADDFCAACEEADVPVWRVNFGCISRRYHGWLGYTKPFTHAVNIVEVDYPGPFRKFCLVEPQENDVVTCWIDDELEVPPPAHALEDIHEYYDPLGYQDCIDEGWPEFWELD